MSVFRPLDEAAACAKYHEVYDFPGSIGKKMKNEGAHTFASCSVLPATESCVMSLAVASAVGFAIIGAYEDYLRTQATSRSVSRAQLRVRKLVSPATATSS
jgi:hypothetical protein